AASKRKLERMGIVVLRSTTPCVAVSSLSSSNLLTLMSIAVPCIAAVVSTAIVSHLVRPRTEHSPRTLHRRENSRSNLLLLLPLISNRKHIKPVVIVGSLEKWKIREEPRGVRSGNASRCIKPKPQVTVCADKPERIQNSILVFHRFTLRPQPAQKKSACKSEKPREMRGL